MGRVRMQLATAAIVFVAVVGTALGASTNFDEPASSPEPVGSDPVAIAATDLDGDGDQDLAIANRESNDVTILKNNGGGAFHPAVSSPEPVGTDPRSLALADLDGDGDRDLAVANYESRSVTLLKNHGNGNFYEPASPKRVPSRPVSIVAADLNGDGDQDLAVAHLWGFQQDSFVTILRNNGLGAFSQPPSSPRPIRGKSPYSIAAADVDGDTDQDLITANLNSGNVSVLKNNGHGNFFEADSSPEPIAAGINQFPRDVEPTDLDGDGDQDLVVAMQRFPDSVAVLKNDGTGDFERAPSPAVADTASTIAPADFDRDGDDDLAVATHYHSGDGAVTILRNRRAGEFVEPATSPEEDAGESPFAVVAADLDDDGDQDLAVANVASDNVSILRNR